MVTIIIVFDPLGGKTAPHSSAGPAHLDTRESSQLLSGLKTAATSVWETRVRLLCCCVGADDHTRGAFTSTAELFSTYFSVSSGGLLWSLSVSLTAASPGPPSPPPRAVALESLGPGPSAPWGAVSARGGPLAFALSLGWLHVDTCPVQVLNEFFW